MILPPVPKIIDIRGVKDHVELAKRLSTWCVGADALLRALRGDLAQVDAQIAAALEDVDASGPPEAHASTHLPSGSDPLASDTPGAVTPGDAAQEGTAEAFALADHQHSVPAFGNGSGEFCEGDDARLSDDRTASGLRTASTVVDVSAATAPSANQILKATSSTAATWQDARGIGTVWHPDVPPTSPHSKDDEFLGSSLDGAWSEWDQETRQAVTVGGGYVKIAMTSADGDDHWGGIYKAIPSTSEYTLYTKCSLLTSFANVAVCGMFIAGDISGSPGTAAFRTVEFYHSGSTFGVLTRTWSNYSGTVSSSFQAVNFNAVYLRFRVDGTTIRADVSVDGMGWMHLGTNAVAFTPTYMGLGANFVTNSSDPDQSAKFHFFRVYEGSGEAEMDGNIIGGYL